MFSPFFGIFEHLFCQISISIRDLAAGVVLEDAYALSADFGGANRAGNVSAEHFQPAAVGLAQLVRESTIVSRIPSIFSLGLI